MIISKIFRDESQKLNSYELNSETFAVDLLHSYPKDTRAYSSLHQLLQVPVKMGRMKGKATADEGKGRA